MQESVSYKTIDSWIEKGQALSQSEINQAYSAILESPLRFIKSGNYWAKTLYQSIIPFIGIISVRKFYYDIPQLINLSIIVIAMAVILLNRNFSFTHTKIVAVYRARYPKLNPLMDLPSLRIFRIVSIVVFITFTCSFILL